MQTYTPGDSFHLTVLRGAKQFKSRVTLTVLPDGYEMAYTRRVFGFDLRATGHGLVIDKIIDGSPAAQVGLRPDDLLVKVDGVSVEKLLEYKQAIEDRLGRTPLTFTIVRDNYGYLVELP